MTTDNTAPAPVSTEARPMIRHTAYEVSCVPEGNINRSAFTITVEYRGRGKWAVNRSGYALAVDGTWSYEPLPSNRDDEWLSRHRFIEPEALRLAASAAPHLTVNGHTVADVLKLAETEVESRG